MIYFNNIEVKVAIESTSIIVLFTLSTATSFGRIERCVERRGGELSEQLSGATFGLLSMSGSATLHARSCFLFDPYVAG